MCQIVCYLRQICMMPAAIVPASVHVSLFWHVQSHVAMQSWLFVYRYDVLLQANQPVGNYWINVLAKNATRTGSPGGYGVLRYAGANLTLPSAPILQPESIPGWDFGTLDEVNICLDSLQPIAKMLHTSVHLSHEPSCLSDQLCCDNVFATSLNIRTLGGFLTQ